MKKMREAGQRPGARSQSTPGCPLPLDVTCVEKPVKTSAAPAAGWCCVRPAGRRLKTRSSFASSTGSLVDTNGHREGSRPVLPSEAANSCLRFVGAGHLPRRPEQRQLGRCPVRLQDLEGAIGGQRGPTRFTRRQSRWAKSFDALHRPDDTLVHGLRSVADQPAAGGKFAVAHGQGLGRGRREHLGRVAQPVGQTALARRGRLGQTQHRRRATSAARCSRSNDTAGTGRHRRT